MKELMESLKSRLTVSELAEKFREQTSNMIPGDWKVVGNDSIYWRNQKTYSQHLDFIRKTLKKRIMI